MELNNPKYKNIGIHLTATIFTVDKGVTKVLLIKRNNEPYKGYWALPGGAMYNDERIKDGILRELKEKVGIDNIELNTMNDLREYIYTKKRLIKYSTATFIRCF